MLDSIHVVDGMFVEDYMAKCQRLVDCQGLVGMHTDTGTEDPDKFRADGWKKCCDAYVQLLAGDTCLAQLARIIAAECTVIIQDSAMLCRHQLTRLGYTAAMTLDTSASGNCLVAERGWCADYFAVLHCGPRGAACVAHWKQARPKGVFGHRSLLNSILRNERYHLRTLLMACLPRNTHTTDFLQRLEACEHTSTSQLRQDIIHALLLWHCVFNTPVAPSSSALIDFAQH